MIKKEWYLASLKFGSEEEAWADFLVEFRKAMLLVETKALFMSAKPTVISQRDKKHKMVHYVYCRYSEVPDDEIPEPLDNVVHPQKFTYTWANAQMQDGRYYNQEAA